MGGAAGQDLMKNIVGQSAFKKMVIHFTVSGYQKNDEVSYDEIENQRPHFQRKRRYGVVL